MATGWHRTRSGPALLGVRRRSCSRRGTGRRVPLVPGWSSRVFGASEPWARSRVAPPTASRTRSIPLDDLAADVGDEQDEEHEQHADCGGDVRIPLLDALLVEQEDGSGGGTVGSATTRQEVGLREQVRAGDDGEQHHQGCGGAYRRNGDRPVCLPPVRAVEGGRFIQLLRDVLERGEEEQDEEAQLLPGDVELSL